jgi:formylglycine-generating enzyme required for sulfatase activity
MDAEERQHIESLLKQYRRRLRVLEQQAARFGLNAPAELIIEIQDLRDVIDQLQLQLNDEDQPSLSSPKSQNQTAGSANSGATRNQSSGVSGVDHPDDEEKAQPKALSLPAKIDVQLASNDSLVPRPTTIASEIPNASAGYPKPAPRPTATRLATRRRLWFAVVSVLVIVIFSTIAVNTWPSRGPLTSSPNLAPTSLPRRVLVPVLVEVSANPFLMGSTDSDPLADDREKPQHTLNLPTYWIGMTEVTNAEFQPFVKGDGYTNPAYWSEAGWAWRQENNKITQPAHWNNTNFSDPEQPVVGVNWFEALAYVRWLSKQTGHEFRLPSEAEWEKAARGTDGRIWPWGNIWEAGRANSKEAGTDRTTPAGKYPNGVSPYGALDMAGNVWEWCATKWDQDYPYQLEDEWQAAYLEADTRRILRGGSWAAGPDGQRLVRAAYRNLQYGDPDFRTSDVGLRVASDSSLPLLAPE